MFLKVLLSLCLNAFAVDYAAEFRYRADSSTTDTTGSSLVAGFPISEDFRVETGARLYTGWATLHSFHYKGEIAYRVLPFLQVKSRLHHGYRFSNPTSVTHFTLSAHFEEEITGLLLGSLELGWYERFSRVDGGLPIPIFFSNPRREHDPIIQMGLGIQWNEDWRLWTDLATFDEIEVENLNNPYVGLRLQYQWPSVGEFTTFFRYKILLGFGRWNQLVMGVSLAVPLTPQSGSDSSLQFPTQ